VIHTHADGQGGTSFSTEFSHHHVELLYVTPVGTLSFGETFLGGSGFAPDWVPTLIDALKMAHDLADRR